MRPTNVLPRVVGLCERVCMHTSGLHRRRDAMTINIKCSLCCLHIATHGARLRALLTRHHGIIVQTDGWPNMAKQAEQELKWNHTSGRKLAGSVVWTHFQIGRFVIVMPQHESLPGYFSSLAWCKKGFLNGYC